jgi:AcrR family transcriptional regulator
MPTDETRTDIYERADLTAKARIRDAALALIAERGVAGATVRSIAERSQVSPSLVLHHFGSKQAVVEEVSGWALRLLREATRAADLPGSPADAHQSRLAIVGKLLAETPNLAGYLRRMLLDARPEGLDWFRESVRTTAADVRARERQGLARPSKDLEVEAAMLVILGLAPLLLKPLLEHALDVDLAQEHVLARWREAQHELLTSALYPPEAPGPELRR